MRLELCSTSLGQRNRFLFTSFIICKVMISKILTDEKALGIKITQKAAWNLKMVGSFIYQIYVSQAIKMWPAKNPENDIEIDESGENSEYDGEFEDDEVRKVKYLGDPVSKIVYNKAELEYLFKNHFEDVPILTQEIIKLFDLSENLLLLSAKMRFEKYKMKTQKI